MATAPKKIPAVTLEHIVEPPIDAAPTPDAPQSNLRTAVEKSLAETQAAYVKAKANVDETASALESSYAAAKAGVVAINVKAFEALRDNVEANFDFVKSAITVKNVTDYVTLQSEFARKRLEAMADQTQQLSALARKLATETAEPIKEQVAKSFKIAV